VVVQRYGADVVGGSEAHARIAARRLARRHRVEVATTNALDFWTWAPHFGSGVTRDDGVTVRRFGVEARRARDYKAIETRVLLEDHLLEYNRQFHERLEAMKVPHVYREFPGTHDWDYWDRHIPEALAFHARHLGIRRRTK